MQVLDAPEGERFNMDRSAPRLDKLLNEISMVIAGEAVPTDDWCEANYKLLMYNMKHYRREWGYDYPRAAAAMRSLVKLLRKLMVMDENSDAYQRVKDLIFPFGYQLLPTSKHIEEARLLLVNICLKNAFGPHGETLAQMVKSGGMELHAAWFEQTSIDAESWLNLKELDYFLAGALEASKAATEMPDDTDVDASSSITAPTTELADPSSTPSTPAARVLSNKMQDSPLENDSPSSIYSTDTNALESTPSRLADTSSSSTCSTVARLIRERLQAHTPTSSSGSIGSRFSGSTSASRSSGLMSMLDKFESPPHRVAARRPTTPSPASPGYASDSPSQSSSVGAHSVDEDDNTAFDTINRLLERHPDLEREIAERYLVKLFRSDEAQLIHIPDEDLTLISVNDKVAVKSAAEDLGILEAHVEETVLSNYKTGRVFQQRYQLIMMSDDGHRGYLENRGEGFYTWTRAPPLTAALSFPSRILPLAFRNDQENRRLLAKLIISLQHSGDDFIGPSSGALAEFLHDVTRISFSSSRDHIKKLIDEILTVTAALSGTVHDSVSEAQLQAANFVQNQAWKVLLQFFKKHGLVVEYASLIQHRLFAASPFGESKGEVPSSTIFGQLGILVAQGLDDEQYLVSEIEDVGMSGAQPTTTGSDSATTFKTSNLPPPSNSSAFVTIASFSQDYNSLFKADKREGVLSKFSATLNKALASLEQKVELGLADKSVFEGLMEYLQAEDGITRTSPVILPMLPIDPDILAEIDAAPALTRSTKKTLVRSLFGGLGRRAAKGLDASRRG